MEHPAVHGWRRLLLATQRIQGARERDQGHAQLGEMGRTARRHARFAPEEGPANGSESPVLRGRKKRAPSVIPATLLQNTNIQDYLQAADHVAPLSPLVARMLNVYAYKQAMEMDPESEGRGVLQFKTSLHTLLWRQKSEGHEETGVDAEDAAAFQEFCRAYRQRLQELEKWPDQHREELAIAWKTARVLTEVLHSLGERNPNCVSGELEREMADDAAAKTELLSKQRYNIVPLNIHDSREPIMELAEIKEAVAALESTGDLPRQPGSHVPFGDMLDFLKFTFGFQADSVHNQREHCVLLLANLMTRSISEDMARRREEAVEELFDIIMMNYRAWMRYLGLQDPYLSAQSTWKIKLLFVSLYLLIWGEAANVRFVPECLCYLFHRMALEMVGMLSERDAQRSLLISSPNGHYEFLHNVILPLYLVIKEEAQYGGHGFDAKGHEEWRNYDDLNEYFWSTRCMELGWPLDLSQGFFTTPPPTSKQNHQAEKVATAHAVPTSLQELRDERAVRAGLGIGRGQLLPTQRGRSAGAGAGGGGMRESKSLFVEWRTFWHVYHSFDRHWIFLFLMLQAMVIIAFGSPNKAHTIYKMLTLAPAAAVFLSLQAAVDVGLSWGAYRSMTWAMIWGKWLRLLTSAGWAAALVFFAVKMLGELNHRSKAWLGPNIGMVAGYILPRVVINVLRRFSPLRTKVDGISDWAIFRFLRWLYQEEYFVGRGMFENTETSFLYMAFWVVLFICKFLFSYYFMIQPLVVPTRYIADFVHLRYRWHDILSGQHWNFLTLASIWAPVVIIYLLDTSIWYTVLSALGGGVIGAYWHLGEIRTLSMVRARFKSFPQEFVRKLQPVANMDRTLSGSARPSNGQQEVQIMERRDADRFAVVWNEIIRSMREEDLLSNRERDLLLLPQSEGSPSVQWPLFLLANKVMLALGIAEAHEESDPNLWKRICDDYYMRTAVTELYGSLRDTLLEMTAGSDPRYDTYENWIVKTIFGFIESSILQLCFVSSFKLKKLRLLHGKLSDLTAVLIQPQTEELTAKAVALMQTLYKVTTRDFLDEDLRMRLEGSPMMQDLRMRSGLFTRIIWPARERTRRLHQLLTIADSAKGVPLNLEARRRLQFFTNSLFMSMPDAPPVHKMVSFCVMTPYYSEIVKYSKDELTKENEDGISTLFYLQKIFPDEWENLSERINVKQSHVEASMGADKEGMLVQEVRKWASYRGQTLARTVRGMMYYRRALRLLAYMESGREQDLEQGQEGGQAEAPEGGYLRDSTRALADLKFTYVVTCQIYGAQKASNDARAVDIFDLMKAHEGLRVAYIDEVEAIRGEGGSRVTVKEYFSRLVKVDSFGQEQNVYRIKLPGPAKQGEGKPENQNHAIIFTRGEALQTIDMNQDNYLEEAMKVRNLLQEFRRRHGLRRPTILGVREHVFTGSVSSLAWFMSNQETSFVTLGQRFMARPLKVRMHYGHPDVFDRLFHITRGGISKASKTINISEDIFAGFNTTLRQGNVTHHEYIQVGKGRDVGLNQIALFEAKVASGNGEQVLSRDVYRLGQLFDFHRMMSFFYTSVGFYVCTMLTVWCVYFFLYGKVYMALSGVEKTLSTQTDTLGNKALTAALNTQFLLQIGVFTAVPMVVGFILEQGFLQALVSFVTLQLQMASVFFTFSLGTRTHYFGRTILHGGAKYRSTGRGFVVGHEKFAENYRLFSRSHFVKGLEVAMLLIVYLVYGTSSSSSSFILLSFSSWFMAISWCFAPFIFNPSGFEWQKTVQDFEDWVNWLFYSGGIGMKGEQSWEAWWEEELSHIRTLRGRFLEVILSLRFFLFQYGIAYQLHVDKGSNSILIYAYSWAAIGGVFLLIWVSNLGRTWDVQWAVRLLQGSLFVAALLLLILLIVFTALTISDVFACILGIIPTGWGIIQIAIALKPVLVWLGWWKRIRSFARLYDAGMGALIFFPVALLSWFPFVSTFQTRLMFNQAFSRGLEISLILAGNKANKND